MSEPAEKAWAIVHLDEQPCRFSGFYDDLAFVRRQVGVLARSNPGVRYAVVALVAIAMAPPDVEWSGVAS